jgi:hypothetical protein
MLRICSDMKTHSKAQCNGYVAQIRKALTRRKCFWLRSEKENLSFVSSGEETSSEVRHPKCMKLDMFATVTGSLDSSICIANGYGINNRRVGV